MIIIITSVPALVPWSKTTNFWLPKKAPPERMREIWVNQELDAALNTTGYYSYVPDKKAKVQRLVTIEGISQIWAPKKLVYKGAEDNQVIHSLTHKQGMGAIKKATDDEYIIDWYRLRWPEESGFFFHESEVRVIAE